MKTYLDCTVCFLKQALELGRRMGLGPTAQEEMVKRTAARIAELNLDESPPLMGRSIHRLIRSLCGRDDPYEETKRLSNEIAMKAVEAMEGEIARGDAPLETAIRLAAAANVMDLGALPHLTPSALAESLEEAMAERTELRALDALEKRLADADSMLLLCDNAGEIAFDVLLVRILKELYPRLRITAAVRGAPVINDATMRDAEQVGLTEVCDVITNGSDIPGTHLPECPPAFLEVYEEADLVLSKGQGNYETLSAGGEAGPQPTRREGALFFLLKAKCDVVAGDLAVEKGAVVLEGPVCKPHSRQM